jgi:hypothetical protein
MVKKRNNPPKTNPDFVRKTVTIPADLDPFATEQSRKPEHAGNLSSYIRTLILRDREKSDLKAA